MHIPAERDRRPSLDGRNRHGEVRLHIQPQPDVYHLARRGESRPCLPIERGRHSKSAHDGGLLLAGRGLPYAAAAPTGSRSLRDRTTFRLEHSRSRRWEFRKLCRRPPRAREQFTAAVRADSGEALFGAVTTERALEGANPRRGRIGRQISVAALAPGTHLKHEEHLRNHGRASLNQALRNPTRDFRSEGRLLSLVLKQPFAPPCGPPVAARRTLA